MCRNRSSMCLPVSRLLDRNNVGFAVSENHYFHRKALRGWGHKRKRGDPQN